MYQHFARNFKNLLRQPEGLSLCMRQCQKSNLTLAAYERYRPVGVLTLNNRLRPSACPNARICTTCTHRPTTANVLSTSETRNYRKDLGHDQRQYPQTYMSTSASVNVHTYRDLMWNENRKEFHTRCATCAKSDGGTGHIQTHKQTGSADEGTKTEKAETEDATSAANLRLIAPSNFDRKILVWTGKYSSLETVPSLVSDATLNWAKNKFRVYVNIAMAVGTFCTALVMIGIGKYRADHGESVSKMNMMRHPTQYQQQLGAKTSEKLE